MRVRQVKRGDVYFFVGVEVPSLRGSLSKLWTHKILDPNCYYYHVYNNIICIYIIIVYISRYTLHIY